MLSANHSAYAFNNFYPSIVRGFNLGSNTITLVCTAPPYLIGALITFAMAYNSDRINERGWHIIASMAVAIVGFIISVATLNVPARYFASFLYIAGCFTGNSLVFAWGASTTSQTPEKRACATAIINVLGQAGNIWYGHLRSIAVACDIMGNMLIVHPGALTSSAQAKNHATSKRCS